MADVLGDIHVTICISDLRDLMDAADGGATQIHQISEPSLPQASLATLFDERAKAMEQEHYERGLRDGMRRCVTELMGLEVARRNERGKRLCLQHLEHLIATTVGPTFISADCSVRASGDD